MKSVFIPILVVLIILSLATINEKNSEENKDSKIEEIIANAEKNKKLEVYKIVLEDYLKAIKIDSDEISYYHEYLDISFNTKRYYEFQEMANRTMNKFPNDKKAYLMLCRYYLEEDESKKLAELNLKAKENLDEISEFKKMYFQVAYKFIYKNGTFQEANTFVGYCAVVKSEDKYGIIDTNSNYIISPIYDSAEVFSLKMASVKLDGKVYYVDNDEDKVLASNQNVEKAYPFIQKLAVVKVDGKYGYATEDFSIKDLKWEFATSYYNDMAAVKKNNKWAIRNYSRELLTDFKYDDIKYDENLICSYSSLIFALEKGKYYIINSKGKKISNTGYDDAKAFSEDGIAPVKLNGKWGFIDSEGELLIDFQYEDANQFQNGLAPVKIDKYWVYIDSNNKVVIEDYFQEAKPFSEVGIAAVKKNDRWQYIELIIRR